MDIKNKLKKCFIPCVENNYKPKFLAGEVLFYIVLVLFVLKIVAVSFIFYYPKTVFFADLTKTALVQLTNQERQSLGLSTLKENTKLNEAALQKAQDMLTNDYFSHNSPQGISPWYWIKQSGYNYKTAGENLAIGFLDSEEVLNAWNNSPSHKENLLNPKFQEIGIAVATGDFNGAETTVVVQLLGTPSSSIIKTATTVTTVSKTTTTTKPIVNTNTNQQTETVETPAKSVTLNTEDKLENQPKAVGGEATTSPNIVQISSVDPEIKNDSWSYRFYQFMAVDYPQILQKVIFYSLLVIILTLILNILIQVKHQDKRLILKTLAFIGLLILFVISDKELIVQFIPHSLLI